jgi:gliding motility-associated-like protein
MLKRFITICLLITAAFTASADVFTVTSNADAGTGTLRQALTLAAANGITVKDYIYFNLPGSTITDRTITLVTQLPLISSNLVIDGSTQPGTKFGEGDARVRISTPVSNDTFTTLRLINIKDVELYGIYLLDYTYTNAIWPDVGQRTALQIEGSENIILGALNKGNMIKGFHDFSVLAKKVNGLKISSNLFGLNENNNFDHPPYGSPAFSAGVILDDCDNLIFGGDATSEGNTLFCTVSISYSDKSVVHSVDVKSNNMGVFKDGITTNPYYQGEYNILIFTNGINSSGPSPAELEKAVTVNLNIKNNVTGNFSRSYYINGLKGNVSFTNNYIGVARDGVTSVNHNNSVPNQGAGFNIDNTLANVVIGGTSLSDKNLFYDHTNCVQAQNSPNIFIRNNDYRCIVYYTYAVVDHPETLPQITIKKAVYTNTQTALAGTASPNSTIDIYGSTSCDYANCSIGSKITTVNADAGGNWSTTVNSFGTFYASATISNRTSLFKTFEVITTDIVVNHLRCTNQGSITGFAVPEGVTYYWVNEQGTRVSSDLNLTTTTPGKYKLILNSGCVSSNFYEIKDNRVIFYDSGKLITGASCGMAVGSIKGIFYYDPLNMVKDVSWKNSTGTTVSTQADAINLPAGSYFLTINTLDGCQSTYGPVNIINTTGPNINESNPVKTPSSCTIANGSIHGVTATGTNVKYSWKNEQNIEVGTLADLDGQPAGKYTLTVTDDSNCGPVTSSPIEILPVNDITINIATRNVQDANCDNSDGNITNIQVTGTGTYLWTNEQGVDVGHDKDLTGVPAGKYKLTVSSANCPPVSTELIDILSIHDITINDAQKTISKATCQYDNGGISNIHVTGATKYTWYNASNVSVSNNLELTGMPTGNYYLIAANDNGCSKQSAVYTITRETPVSYGGITKKLKNATCDENNGSIEVIFQNTPAVLPDSYKWVNTATGQAVNTSTPILTGIDAGTYDIYSITNGCEQYLINYSIGRDPGLTVITNNIQKNDDHCSSGTGSIKGIHATGTTPLSFTWTDDNGLNKGAAADLLNIPAGTYHLKITDGANCEQGFVYTVYDQSDNIAPPTVNDVQLCSPGSALLSVSNADNKYGYRLYEDNNSATPIDEQQNGSFKVNVKANSSYYISQYVGNCESSRQEVKILISGISGADIANTFTPNGDGINDYWKITGMENYTNGTVKVFNRNGKMVYQSKGYAIPFDGTLNSKPLPAGVYYYIIDLKSCNLISGNLTILR